jgi:hypothetical protein
MVLEGFERYTQRGRSFKPKIAIRKRGQIGFNKGAIKKFKIDDFENAILFINKERTKIAIKFTNDSEEEGAMNLVKRSSNYFVSGKAFLDYYEIEYDKTSSYTAHAIESNIAVIDLTEQEGNIAEKKMATSLRHQ